MTGSPADDASIEDDERLLRRVHPDHMVYDENRQRWRPSSAAFDDVYDGVSVFLSSTMQQIGLAEANAVDGYPEHSLVVVPAGEARGLDPPLGVVRDPDPPGVPPHVASPAHALITGIPDSKAGRKKHRKPLAERIARDFVVFRPPTGLAHPGH